MDIAKLLKELEGAGVDITSLSEHTGGFTKSIESFVTEIGNEEAEKARAEAKDAAAKAEKWEAEAAENFKRMQNKDTALSEKDLKIKKLESQLTTRQTVNTSDTDSAVTAAIEAMRTDMGSKIETLMTKMEAAEQENQRLAAEVKWNQTVDGLTEQFPVLKEPKFKDLIPKTTDETVLRARAQLLTDFQAKTQESAFMQVREGYVPPSAPPRVTPGDDASFEAEMTRINTQVDLGTLTPQDASVKLQELAALMKPE